MPPDRIRMRPLAPCSATMRSSNTCAMMLRAVLAWQTKRIVFTTSATSTLFPRPLPEASPTAQIRPLRRWTFSQLPSKVRRRRHLQIGAERLREELRQFLGIEPSIRLDPSHGLGLGEQRVAVPERMEDLAIDVGRGATREVHDERRHIVRIAFGADGLLARPLAGLLEDRPAARRGVDHARRAAR